MSKKIDFSFMGGFPLDEETLNSMQLAYYELFKSLSSYIGLTDTGNFILTGVEVTDTDISEGWVYMDGDIIWFPALTGTTGLTTKLLKQTIGTNATFEDTSTHAVYINNSVVIDASGVALSTFTRIQPIPEGQVQSDWDQADNTAVNYIKNKPIGNLLNYLLKGNYHLGDVPATDGIFTISFSTVGTSSYMVVGSLVSEGDDWNNDNDAFFVIREKTATSFKIALREVTANTQNLSFDYCLIPF